MRRELAERLGLIKAPLVVTGGHDQACAALGVGLVDAGLAMDSTGTAEVVEVALAEPVLNQVLYGGNVSVYAHTAPGLYLAMTLNHSGGISLRWFRDAFCQEEIRRAQVAGQDAYDLILANVSPDPSPLFVMPHLAGSGTPWFDTSSRGTVLGLTLGATKSDLAKALLEGLTYELRINLDLLKEGGVSIQEVRAVGGGARSPLWMQLKADITGLPVVVPQVSEAACWGAAILAGVGAGLFADPAQAAEEMLRLESRFEPDPERSARYAQRYDLYREIYPAVRGIQGRM
jgi:xylulokinase